MRKNQYYWTCPYCGANLDPGERCDCEESRSKDTDNYKSVEREGMIRMFCPNMKHRTFVCLDDISCHIEEFNNVIYNPNTDGIPERVDKLFRIIKERFDVELTSEQLIHLTKYESYQLEEFVNELKKYINAKK